MTLAVAPGAQLVHREGEHVGGARLVHPLHVQVGHDVGVDEDDRQLGLRVHAHGVEHVAAERGELRLVDLVTRTRC